MASYLLKRSAKIKRNDQIIKVDINIFLYGLLSFMIYLCDRNECVLVEK